uniref:Hypothetical secreted protein 743 n=1 Tax=Amblyomma variegatum TaxID=34610 RepID=F0JA77_AMBVA|nr:TPA_inf: hypothetical secreted protein 743 [Amblyomma variegatum]
MERKLLGALSRGLFAEMMHLWMARYRSLLTIVKKKKLMSVSADAQGLARLQNSAEMAADFPFSLFTLFSSVGSLNKSGVASVACMGNDSLLFLHPVYCYSVTFLSFLNCILFSCVA